MRLARFGTLRVRIISLVVLAASFAVGLFTATISWVNTSSSVLQLNQRLTTLADIIGQNSTAALDFNDRKAAAEVLQALASEPSVVSACLYDRAGHLFSEYAHGRLACSSTAGRPPASGDEYRRVSRTIRHASESAGSIELTADMVDLHQRNRHMLLLAIGLALLSMWVAGGAGAVLQRRISRPVMELASAMNKITTEATFDLRVGVEGSNEIAQLAHGFNRMIGELERRNRIARDAELRLIEQSRTDALTSLPNRRHLVEQLRHELARASREKRMIGLLYIDLDGFKLVNDSLGHGMGDLLLCQVATRFASRVRASDTLARLGGDEFTVILTALERPEDARQAADALIECLVQPFMIEGNQITVGASIGITTQCPSSTEDPDLLKQADNAMYAAKRSGKNRAVHFSAELGMVARERLTLENELRGAIGRHEIFVLYQPEFDLKSGSLVRFEALARWKHPHLGDISPATFIPIAEDSGLIHILGEFVMEQACRRCLTWQNLPGAPVQIAVNVSALQFNSEDFVDIVSSILNRTGLPPKLLQIELTESVMIGSLSHTRDKILRLRTLGVNVAIDDFGTGYSSLGYLSQLPFTALKIDRTFLNNRRPTPESITMVQSMIELGHKMGLRVIVEGIEEERQLEMIREMGADDAQGYLLGRPGADPELCSATCFQGSIPHLEEKLHATEKKLAAAIG
jgi:diguanylate cyclase (GGDEF)-like protein